MSKELLYPSQDLLEFWINLLKRDRPLGLVLPQIDENWYLQVLEITERVQYSYSSPELHQKAAELFYNICKAHAYIDGNKRSSIVVVYLFYILNDHFILNRLDVRQLAKSVARSKGRKNHDQWIEKIIKRFKKNTLAINY